MVLFSQHFRSADIHSAAFVLSLLSLSLSAAAVCGARKTVSVFSVLLLLDDM